MHDDDPAASCEHILLSRRFVEGREGEVQFCVDCDQNDPLIFDERDVRGQEVCVMILDETDPPESDLHPRGPDNAAMKAWWQERGYRFEGDPGGPLSFAEALRAEMITGMENEVDRSVRDMLHGDGTERNWGGPSLRGTAGVVFEDPTGFQADPLSPLYVPGGLADWAIKGG